MPKAIAIIEYAAIALLLAAFAFSMFVIGPANNARQAALAPESAIEPYAGADTRADA